MRLGTATAICIAALSSGPAAAAELVPVTVATQALRRSADDLTILTIEADGRQTAVALSDIEKLPRVQTTLETSWGTKGLWEGVLMADILDAFALRSAPSIQFIALDNYVVKVSAADLRERRALLATRLDGKPLAIEQRGPAILLWPGEADAALDGSVTLANWIWSVSEIVGAR